MSTWDKDLIKMVASRQFKSACVTMFKWGDCPAGDFYFNEDYIRFAVWQLEKAPDTGKLHLQMYCEGHRQYSRDQWKDILGENSAHIEEARKSRDICVKYCSKEDTRVEGPFRFGQEVPVKGGRPSSRESAIRVILERIAEVGETEFKKEDFMTWSMYKREIRSFLNDRRTYDVEARQVAYFQEAVLLPWQAALLAKVDSLLSSGDRRKILWVHSEQGNVKKSWMAGYLMALRGAFVAAGKMDAVQYAYNGERVCVLDIPRAQLNFMDQLYTVGEMLKNGAFLNSKYESCVKKFDPPVCVFFANAPPNRDLWSPDRYVEFNLNHLDFFEPKDGRNLIHTDKTFYDVVDA